MAVQQSSSEKVILYDIPSRSPCSCWSPNTWKARLVLNYKQIPYTTTWVEYPDIEPTFRSAGVPPNDLSKELWPYTAPAVQLLKGQWVMESQSIAEKLESLYPSPSLHLDSSYVARINDTLDKIYDVTEPIYQTGVPKLLLNPRSADYFKEDRKRMLGMSLEQMEQEMHISEIFEATGPHIRELTAMLKEIGDGPFLMGKEVSYADFLIVGWLRFMEKLEVLDEIIRADPEPLRALYAAAAPWLERDDH